MNARFQRSRIAVRVATAAMAVSIVGLAPSLSWAGDDAQRVRVNAPASVGDAAAETATAEPNAEAANEAPLRRRGSNELRGDEADSGGAAGIRLPKTNLFETFWPMLAVLGLILACGAAVRKWLPQATRVSGGSAVNVLARQYLSSKQSLCLVKVGKRVVLVGVTPDAMRTLTEIDDPEEIASLAATLQRGKGESFSSALRRQSFETADDMADESDEIAMPQRHGAERMGETENRIRDLVGRIRALSTGSAHDTTRAGRRQ